MILLLGVGIGLMLIGFWGLLTRQNMIRLVLSLGIAETGLQILMISVGYLKGRTAPILDAAVPAAQALNRVVDPVPQALVLTAIVIGVAVNALMLTFIIRLFEKRKTLNISDYRDLKW